MIPSNESHNPIDQAISSAGGLRALARALGLSAPSVMDWKRRNSVPAERVLQIEAATGVSRHDLRPDIYPRDRVA